MTPKSFASVALVALGVAGSVGAVDLEPGDAVVGTWGGIFRVEADQWKIDYDQPSPEEWVLISAPGSVAFPRSIAIDGQGQIVVAAAAGLFSDNCSWELLRFDPASGAPTLIASFPAPCDSFWSPKIAIGPFGDVFFADGSGALVAVDPSTGTHHLVAGGSFGGAIASTSDGTLLAAEAGGLVRIDPASGEQTLVFRGPVTDLTIGEGGDAFLLSGESVVRLDPSSGAIIERVDLSLAVPLIAFDPCWPEFAWKRIWADADGRLVLSASWTDSATVCNDRVDIYRLSIDTHQADLIASCDHGGFGFTCWSWPIEIAFVRPACDDRLDNDLDGRTDFPADPSCRSLQWPTETTESACWNGLDDDGDGLADFPEDPGCGSPDWSTEAPACDDGIDNDGDGSTDFPADLGCESASSAWERTQCDDGLDNDRDGRIDLLDPDCRAASDRAERPPSSCGLGFELALFLPLLMGGTAWRRGATPGRRALRRDTGTVENATRPPTTATTQ